METAHRVDLTWTVRAQQLRRLREDVIAVVVARVVQVAVAIGVVALQRGHRAGRGLRKGWALDTDDLCRHADDGETVLEQLGDAVRRHERLATRHVVPQHDDCAGEGPGVARPDDEHPGAERRLLASRLAGQRPSAGYSLAPPTSPYLVAVPSTKYSSSTPSTASTAARNRSHRCTDNSVMVAIASPSNVSAGSGSDVLLHPATTFSSIWKGATPPLADLRYAASGAGSVRSEDCHTAGPRSQGADADEVVLVDQGPGVRARRGLCDGGERGGRCVGCVGGTAAGRVDEGHWPAAVRPRPVLQGCARPGALLGGRPDVVLDGGHRPVLREPLAEGQGQRRVDRAGRDRDRGQGRGVLPPGDRGSVPADDQGHPGRLPVRE